MYLDERPGVLMGFAAGYIPTKRWGSRGFAPLGCLPLWGSEGVTIVIIFLFSLRCNAYRTARGLWTPGRVQP